MPDSLQFDGIDCSYGYDGDDAPLSPFLSPKTFGVEAGGICLLRGGNGSGKSSFLGALLGRVPIVRGRVRLVSHDVIVHDAPARDIVARIARCVYVPQRASQMFAPRMACETLVQLWADHGGTYRDPQKRWDLLDRLGVSEFVYQARWRHTDRLSGGEAQLLALGLAALRDASLILLDEPTASVSQMGRPKVANMIRTISSMEGRSRFILIASHDEAVSALATRKVDFP
ncbi:MAG: ATP-binding cassette domain-containing protein [Phycisphaerales bacterium]